MHVGRYYLPFIYWL